MWFWEKMALSILSASLPQVIITIIIIIIIINIIIVIIVMIAMVITTKDIVTSARNPGVRGQPKDWTVLLAQDCPARFSGLIIKKT